MIIEDFCPNAAGQYFLIYSNLNYSLHIFVCEKQLFFCRSAARHPTPNALIVFLNLPDFTGKLVLLVLGTVSIVLMN